MSEERKTRNRTDTCAICGNEVSRRKSVDVPHLGRVCRSHRVPCTFCGIQIPLAKAAVLERNGKHVYACTHHEGVEAMVARVEEEPNEETPHEDREGAKGVPDRPPGDRGERAAAVPQ